MKDYQPAEGSKVAEAIAYMRAHGPQPAHKLGEALGTKATNIGPLLVAPIKHGMVLKRGRQRAALYMMADQAQADDLVVNLPPGALAMPAEVECAGSAEPHDFTLAAWNDGDLVLTGPGLRIMAGDDGSAESVVLSAAQIAALVRFVVQPRVVL